MILQATEAMGQWLVKMFPLLVPGNHDPISYHQFEELYKESGQGNFRDFRDGAVMQGLKKNGLVVV